MGRKDKALSVEGKNSHPLSYKMRQSRHSKGISLTKMALTLQYSRGYLSGVENGHISPPSHLIEKYEGVLGLKIGELSNTGVEAKSEVVVPDSSYLDLLQQDRSTWNQWKAKNNEELLSFVDVNLQGVNLRGVDLSYVDLSGADLSGADLGEANLAGADFTTSNLWRANLSEANLKGCILFSADLRYADLRRADLSEADLSEADLTGANLGGARLGEANLSKAIVNKTVFADNNLTTVRGLVDMKYHGPCPLGLATIQLPLDGSALYFLRGTGLPDEWIDFWRTTMMHPIQYHSLFICYSNKDEALARRLHADLQSQGVRCWFAPSDLRIGDKFLQRIDEAIHIQEKVLLLLSEASVASSWIKHEVEIALNKADQQKREVLFPIRLDEAVLRTTNSWAANLRRQMHIGDFTGWQNPEQYEHALQRLLRDLKKVE